MYYTPENMQDKKLSDLSKNKEFLTDAYTFLMSERKGWTEEELSTWSNEDVVDEVLEHFRVQSTNEVTMAKDYYYIDDEMVAEKVKVCLTVVVLKYLTMLKAFLQPHQQLYL
jgi:hypothetical protein